MRVRRNNHPQPSIEVDSPTSRIRPLIRPSGTFSLREKEKQDNEK